MALDHALFSAIRADIDEAFAKVASRHGLKHLTLGRITVDSMGGFAARIAGVTGGGMSPEEQNYNITRRFSGFALPAIGEEFAAGNRRGRVTGQATRGKQRISYVNMDDGKTYLVDPEAFELRFPRKQERASERAMREAAAAMPVVNPPGRK